MERQLVAALYVDEKSHYLTLPNVDAWPRDRDARLYKGPWPVIAHPPCADWGKMRHMAKPPPGRRELAIIAVEQVRLWGGVLEHPEGSVLWDRCGLPKPPSLGVVQSSIDGEFSVSVDQCWFGHRARKRTWLFCVGVSPLAIAEEIRASDREAKPTRRICHGPRMKELQSLGKRARRLTPAGFAEALIRIAATAKGVGHESARKIHVDGTTAFLSKTASTR
jgi:hypothetical protein